MHSYYALKSPGVCEKYLRHSITTGCHLPPDIISLPEKTNKERRAKRGKEFSLTIYTQIHSSTYLHTHTHTNTHTVMRLGFTYTFQYQTPNIFLTPATFLEPEVLFKLE